MKSSTYVDHGNETPTHNPDYCKAWKRNRFGHTNLSIQSG